MRRPIPHSKNVQVVLSLLSSLSPPLSLLRTLPSDLGLSWPENPKRLYSPTLGRYPMPRASEMALTGACFFKFMQLDASKQSFYGPYKRMESRANLRSTLTWKIASSRWVNTSLFLFFIMVFFTLLNKQKKKLIYCHFYLRFVKLSLKCLDSLKWMMRNFLRKGETLLLHSELHIKFSIKKIIFLLTLLVKIDKRKYKGKIPEIS